MSSPITTPTILVIVGISGDLSKRKLLPAIRQIHRAGVLPEHFRIVGITRQALKKDDVLPRGDKKFLRGALTLKQMDLTDPAAYVGLGKDLKKIEDSFGQPAQLLFYLSVPPQASQPVIRLLGQAGLSQKSTKLLLEKPFGSDLSSAEDLINRIHAHFAEDNIYRIDHYLAKEMAQNLVIFRAGNSLLKRTWNKDFIESIDIVSSEEIGIEGRSGFYEQTGALRDVLQSHILQLAALTLMHLPDDWNDWDAIPERRLRALQALTPPQNIRSQVIRGQYEGYQQEAHNPGSRVETFVSLSLKSDDPRWEGVPITLTTGKALDQKLTEIRIRYKQEDAAEANELILRIQPNEGAEILLWIKQPGYERELRQLPLDFSYRHHFAGLPDAYERVFVDAMRGNRALFTTSDEVLASWRILEPVQHHWNMTDDNLTTYKPGSKPEEILQKIKHAG